MIDVKVPLVLSAIYLYVFLASWNLTGTAPGALEIKCKHLTVAQRQHVVWPLLSSSLISSFLWILPSLAVSPFCELFLLPGSLEHCLPLVTQGSAQNLLLEKLSLAIQSNTAHYYNVIHRERFKYYIIYYCSVAFCSPVGHSEVICLFMVTASPPRHSHWNAGSGRAGALSSLFTIRSTLNSACKAQTFRK